MRGDEEDVQRQEAQLMLTNLGNAFRGRLRSPNMVPFDMLACDKDTARRHGRAIQNFLCIVNLKNQLFQARFISHIASVMCRRSLSSSRKLRFVSLARRVSANGQHYSIAAA